MLNFILGIITGLIVSKMIEAYQAWNMQKHLKEIKIKINKNMSFDEVVNLIADEVNKNEKGL